jgi:hypothetical protein
MMNVWINDFPLKTGCLEEGEGDLPAEGLEPTRSCDHWILSPARLPVPPRRRREKVERENTGSRKPCKPLRQIDILIRL